MTDTLTKEERFIFDWQYRRLGDFKSALVNAIKTADKGNLELLRRGFPDEVGGYEKFKGIPGWWDAVVELAYGDTIDVLEGEHDPNTL